MAVSNVSASGAFAEQPSAYGNMSWGSASSSQLGSTTGPGEGTNWAIWQIGISGLPTGKAMTGISISGPCSFSVRGGGRNATLYADLWSSFNQFNGAAGVSVATMPGSGVTQNINYVFKKSNFTSDQLAAGNFFFGFAVQTDSGNSTGGGGTFSLGALSWTIYTAPDDPAPPAGSITTKLINPAANISPGVFPGGQFAQVTLQLLTPLPQSGYSSRFDLPYQSGLTFAKNGSTALNIQSGTVSVPADPYRAYSGLLNVAASTKVGVYSIYGTVSGVSGTGANPTSQQIFSQLTVRSRGGILMTET
jgi:hypothetical protein